MAGAFLGVGYWLGIRSRPNALPLETNTQAKTQTEDDDDDEDEELADGDLAAINPQLMQQCKLV